MTESSDALEKELLEEKAFRELIASIRANRDKNKKPAEKALYKKKVLTRSSGFWLFLFFVYLFYSVVGTIAFFIDHFDKHAAWQIVAAYFIAFFFLKRYLRPRVATVSCSKDEEGAYFDGYWVDDTPIEVDDTPIEPARPVEKPDFFDKLVFYEGCIIFGGAFLYVFLHAVYTSIVNVERVIEFLVSLPIGGSILYIGVIIADFIIFIIGLAGAESGGGISDSLSAQAELRDFNNGD